MEFGALMMGPVTSAAGWRDRARRVEDAGLASLQVSDHFDRSPVSPLLALAAAAQVTSRIRLGTLVLNNDFRHPAVLAKEVASLQVLCDGRLELGIGAGWMDADYAVSGIVRDPAPRRIDRLAGTIALFRALFPAVQDFRAAHDIPTAHDIPASHDGPAAHDAPATHDATVAPDAPRAPRDPVGTDALPTGTAAAAGANPARGVLGVGGVPAAEVVGGQGVSMDGPGFAVRDFRNVPAARVPLRLLVGGGGRRVLRLAGAQADVVGINFDVREGRLGPHATASASVAATDEKVGWVRAAAGERVPVLHLVAYWSEVTERPLEAAARRIAALGLDLTPEQLLASPHCLIGPAGRVVERLAELRERWGFGYVSLYEADLDSMRPVIDHMGRR